MPLTDLAWPTRFYSFAIERARLNWLEFSTLAKALSECQRSFKATRAKELASPASNSLTERVTFVPERLPLLYFSSRQTISFFGD